MSKGYPSKIRARKAFERGVAVGFKRVNCNNPYRNGRLAALFARGRQMGLQGRPPRPRKIPRKPVPATRRPAKAWRGWSGGGR